MNTFRIHRASCLQLQPSTDDSSRLSPVPDSAVFYLSQSKSGGLGDKFSEWFLLLCSLGVLLYFLFSLITLFLTFLESDPGCHVPLFPLSLDLTKTKWNTTWPQFPPSHATFPRRFRQFCGAECTFHRTLRKTQGLAVRKKLQAAVQLNILPEEQCNELKASDRILKSILQSGTRRPSEKG